MPPGNNNQEIFKVISGKFNICIGTHYSTVLKDGIHWNTSHDSHEAVVSLTNTICELSEILSKLANTRTDGDAFKQLQSEARVLLSKIIP